MSQSTSPTVNARIQTALDDIEAAQQVAILYACESGSRAWGFPSPDSDYDVRFVYVHPPAWYLSLNLERKRDVIEYMPQEGSPIGDGVEDDDGVLAAVVLDSVGWDLRKALGLFFKSNAPLMEWLGSPIVYAEHSPAIARWRDLVPLYYQPAACIHHYLRMARTSMRKHLGGQIVSRKWYFYALRPLLAIRWIEAGLGVVPTEFGRLLDAGLVARPLREAMAALVAEKAERVESDRCPRVEILDRFIGSDLERLEGVHVERAAPPPIEPLDELFRSILFHTYPTANLTGGLP